MKEKIDVDLILAPIPGEMPAGEDMRYSKIYEDIKEARKSDDLLEQGEWKRDLKTADWNKVVSLAFDALAHRTKDLQIVTWLTEALAVKDGFDGLSTGLAALGGLLDRYWDDLYPVIDEGDLEFRAAPLEFLNEKVWSRIKDIPVTEEGYSWHKWQESRRVGYEADTLNKYGDIDENKKAQRDEYVSEGKITAEQFDMAVMQSSSAFYEKLAQDVNKCKDGFKELDRIVDERFGNEAPRLAEFGQSIEDCALLISRICKDRGIVESPGEQSGAALESQETVHGDSGNSLSTTQEDEDGQRYVPPSLSLFQKDGDGQPEEMLWQESLKVLMSYGLNEALRILQNASLSVPSVREKNRYRLLMARLCLRADRPDLARPIVEEMNSLIEELHLERWESPVWIAAVLDALYECLTKGETSDEDTGRSKAILQRLCVIDITRVVSKQ